MGLEVPGQSNAKIALGSASFAWQAHLKAGMASGHNHIFMATGPRCEGLGVGLVKGLATAMDLPSASCSTNSKALGRALGELVSEHDQGLDVTAPIGILLVQGDEPVKNLKEWQATIQAIHEWNPLWLIGGVPQMVDQNRFLWVYTAPLPSEVSVDRKRKGKKEKRSKNGFSMTIAIGGKANSTLGETSMFLPENQTVLFPPTEDEWLELLMMDAAEVNPLANLKDVLASEGVELAVDPSAVLRLVEIASEGGLQACNRQITWMMEGVWRHLVPGYFPIDVDHIDLVSQPVVEPEPMDGKTNDTVSDLVETTFSLSRPLISNMNRSGSRFANAEDLKRWSGEDPNDGIGLRGRFLTQDRPGFADLGCPSKLQFSRQNLERHILTVGGTGSGKTSRVMNPLLFDALRDPNQSVVLIDGQGTEAAKAVAAARKYRGKRARIFCFSPCESGSLRFNPLAKIGPQDIRAARSFAFSLGQAMGEVGAGSDRFFREQAIYLISKFVRALQAKHRGVAHLGHLYDLMESGYEGLNELCKDVSKKPGFERMRSELLSDNKNLETALMEVKNLVLNFLDQQVMENTTHSDFTWEEVDHMPSLFIFRIPEEEVDRLRPLTNLVLSSFFDYSTANKRLKQPTTFFIDEFTSVLGRIENFHRRINTLRKRGISFVAAVQSLSQIHSTYRETSEDLLGGFSNKILIPPLTIHDAENASDVSGVYLSQSIVSEDGVSIDRVSQEMVPVLRMDEIQNPPVHPEMGPRCTFLLAGLPCFQGYLEPAYSEVLYQTFLDAEWNGQERFFKQRKCPDELPKEKWWQVDADV